MKRILIALILICLSGCWQSKVHVHPIETADIVAVKKGETFQAPKDGFFLSAEYVQHVMEASVE